MRAEDTSEDPCTDHGFDECPDCGNAGVKIGDQGYELCTRFLTCWADPDKEEERLMIPDWIVHKGFKALRGYHMDLNEKRRERSQEVFGHPGAHVPEFAPKEFEEVRTVVHAVAPDLREQFVEEIATLLRANEYRVDEAATETIITLIKEGRLPDAG